MDVFVDDLDFSTLRIVDENGEAITYNLHQELKVNEDNLAREMLQQPSKYIYWSSILEKIKYFQEQKELALETVVARLDKEARESIESTGKKPTKDSVDAYTKRHPEFQQAKNVCMQYDYTVNRLQRIVKAYEQRASLLQSYGKQVSDDKFYGRGAGSKLYEDNETNPTLNPPWSK